jgi:hypothetical protein
MARKSWQKGRTKNSNQRGNVDDNEGNCSAVCFIGAPSNIWSQELDAKKQGILNSLKAYAKGVDILPTPEAYSILHMAQAQLDVVTKASNIWSYGWLQPLVDQSHMRFLIGGRDRSGRFDIICLMTCPSTSDSILWPTNASMPLLLAKKAQEVMDAEFKGHDPHYPLVDTQGNILVESLKNLLVLSQHQEK